MSTSSAYPTAVVDRETVPTPSPPTAGDGRQIHGRGHQVGRQRRRGLSRGEHHRHANRQRQAAALDAAPEPLSGPRQAAANRTQRHAELRGGRLIALALEVAQQYHRAVPLRQPVELLVHRPPDLLAFHVPAGFRLDQGRSLRRLHFALGAAVPSQLSPARRCGGRPGAARDRADPCAGASRLGGPGRRTWPGRRPRRRARPAVHRGRSPGPSDHAGGPGLRRRPQTPRPPARQTGPAIARPTSPRPSRLGRAGQAAGSSALGARFATAGFLRLPSPHQPPLQEREER